MKKTRIKSPNAHRMAASKVAITGDVFDETIPNKGATTSEVPCKIPLSLIRIDFEDGAGTVDISKDDIQASNNVVFIIVTERETIAFKYDNAIFWLFFAAIRET